MNDRPLTVQQCLIVLFALIAFGVMGALAGLYIAPMLRP